MDMYGGAVGGVRYRKSIPHESRCLRRRQYWLLFIPSTPSCVLGTASRHHTSNSTLLQSVKVNEGAQDGNGCGSGNGVGTRTGTEVETRG